MANITPKPNGTYLIRVSCGSDSQGHPIVKSKVFKPSKPNLSLSKLNREIEIFTQAFEEEIARLGFEERPDKMCFAAFCETYLDIKKSVLSPNTFPFYERAIREQLVPLFGSIQLRDLRAYHVQQYIQFLSSDRARTDGKAGHISSSTVKRYTTVLRSILTQAYKMEYMGEDIGFSRRLEFPKAEKPELEVYTPEEISEILLALETEPLHIRTVVEIALFTGMRRGEIVGLKWEDIDFEQRRLSVKRSIYKPRDGKALEKPPKSKSSIRTITIPERLCETLQAHMEQQKRHASFLGDAWLDLGYILTEEDGHVMNPHTPTKQFKNFLKRHGIRHLKFHGLRHTSATLLLANGCDIKTVSARLGHADIETTNIYVHALECTDRQAADMFDRMIKDKRNQ